MSSRFLRSNTSTSNASCAPSISAGKVAPAVRYAAQFAEEFNAQLTIVHAIPTARDIPSMYVDQDWRHVLVQNAKAQIENLQEQPGNSTPIFGSKPTRFPAASEIAPLRFQADLSRHRPQCGRGCFGAAPHQCLFHHPAVALPGD